MDKITFHKFPNYYLRYQSLYSTKAQNNRVESLFPLYTYYITYTHITYYIYTYNIQIQFYNKI